MYYFLFFSLQRKSEIDYKDMIFFDDERWNISDITGLGTVNSVCVCVSVITYSLLIAS